MSTESSALNDYHSAVFVRAPEPKENSLLGAKHAFLDADRVANEAAACNLNMKDEPLARKSDAQFRSNFSHPSRFARAASGIKTRALFDFINATQKAPAVQCVRGVKVDQPDIYFQLLYCVWHQAAFRSPDDDDGGGGGSCGGYRPLSALALPQ